MNTLTRNHRRIAVFAYELPEGGTESDDRKIGNVDLYDMTSQQLATERFRVRQALASAEQCRRPLPTIWSNGFPMTAVAWLRGRFEAVDAELGRRHD